MGASAAPICVSLFDCENRVVLILDGLLENSVVDVGAELNDRGAGGVADLGGGDAFDLLERLLDACFAVLAHHAFDFHGFLHGCFLLFDERLK